jgi:hypothetical protein
VERQGAKEKDLKKLIAFWSRLVVFKGRRLPSTARIPPPHSPPLQPRPRSPPYHIVAVHRQSGIHCPVSYRRFTDNIIRRLSVLLNVLIAGNSPRIFFSFSLVFQ